ncbi:MAG: hypothetical protein N2235_06335 [Fischerella sp.]|nr:hypothetical protein [Fischerella sp.]
MESASGRGITALKGTGDKGKDKNTSSLFPVPYFQDTTLWAIAHNEGMKISFPIPDPQFLQA